MPLHMYRVYILFSLQVFLGVLCCFVFETVYTMFMGMIIDGTLLSAVC